MRHTFLKTAVLLLTLALAGCSNYIEELTVRTSAREIAVASVTTGPDGTVTITTGDDIPAGTAVTLTYTRDDGTTGEITGTVTDNGDGTRTLAFDPSGIDGVPGGTLPVTVGAPGYLPTPITVSHIPPPVLTVSTGEKTGTDTDGDGEDDTFTVFNSEAEYIPEPTITTNYHDSIDVTTTYTDENGDPIADQDDDGDVDWEDIQKWLKDGDNDGKKVTLTVTATPDPDTEPSKGTKRTLTFKNKKDTVINTVTLPDKVNTGEKTKVTVKDGDGEEYTGRTMTYQWYIAPNETDEGTPIPGATGSTYTPTDDDADKYIYVKVTQDLEPYGGTKTTLTSDRKRVYVAADISLDVEVALFSLTSVRAGNHTVTVTCVKDGVPYSAESTFTAE